MNERERQRLVYSPQLEYVKELILSEGIAASVPPELQRLLEHPPTTVRDLAVELSKEVGELVSALEKRLQGAEGFEAYKASLERTEPADLTPWETGPGRADFLLYRTLRRAHEALSTVAEALTAVVEETPEEEAEKLRQWAEAEVRSRRIREELARLEPLLVDGSPGPADEAFAKLSGELETLEHEMAVRRRDLAGQLAPALSPGLLTTKALMPRMHRLVYGSMVHDIQGDPAPLLKELLDVLAPAHTGAAELRRVLSTIRQALSTLASIRAVTARKAVQLFASYFQRPAWSVFNSVVGELKRLQREIFWPLFAILELLAQTGPEPRGLEGFARQLLRILRIIDQGVDELAQEARRLDRFLTHHLKTSLDEIEQLKQLEGFARMLEEALAELERLPIDLSREVDRRRFVEIVAESRGWNARPQQPEPDDEREDDSA